MTYTLTDEQKKALTEMMGLYWHEWERIYYAKDDYDTICLSCNRALVDYKSHQNRTFTTDADMMDLFRWLVDKGEWKDFTAFAYEQWIESLKFPDTEEKEGFAIYVTWLFYKPDRFCWLVNKAREGVI
jgi:hypothetical protein